MEPVYGSHWRIRDKHHVDLMFRVHLVHTLDHCEQTLTTLVPCFASMNSRVAPVCS